MTAYRQINQAWKLRRPIMISLGVGLVVGLIVGCTSAPWLAGVVSGVGAMGTALGVQLTMWAQRLFAGFRAA